MLKKSALKRIMISTIALVIALLLYIFPKNDINDIQSEILYIENAKIPIYAIDSNKYVARSKVIANNSDVIAYLVDLLTIDSMSVNYLPNNFTGIIPKNTKLLNYSLQDGLLKLNFSKELLNIDKKNSEKLIEAITYTFCELENIDNVMIFIENEKLNTIPNTNKILPPTLNKSIGINKVYSIDNIKNTTKATIYYLGKNYDEFYYIPITKITNEDIKPVEIIVNELKNIPIYETNLISYLNASYELQDYEILENSIKLTFNNLLLSSLKDDDITEKVKYTLALSLKDTYNIKDIDIVIN